MQSIVRDVGPHVFSSLYDKNSISEGGLGMALGDAVGWGGVVPLCVAFCGGFTAASRAHFPGHSQGYSIKYVHHLCPCNHHAPTMISRTSICPCPCTGHNYTLRTTTNPNDPLGLSEQVGYQRAGEERVLLVREATLLSVSGIEDTSADAAPRLLAPPKGVSYVSTRHMQAGTLQRVHLCTGPTAPGRPLTDAEVLLDPQT